MGSGPEEGEIIARLLRLAGPRPDAPQEAKERVKAFVHARWRERLKARRRRRGLGWFAGSLAAAAIVLLIVGLGSRRGAVAPLASAEPAGTLVLGVGVVRGPAGAIVHEGDGIPLGASLETAGDARAALHLLSGATVRLDSATRITLEGLSALGLERGRIYVDSGGRTGERGDLEIRTGIGVVREMGTRFEVRVQDRELRVRVRQGAVNVEREARSHEILPGAELTVDEAGGTKMGTVPLYGPLWSWILDVAPEFRLEGRTLGEFLEWVSSETGLRVRFAGELIEREAAGIVLHGSIAGLRPDQAPDAVLPTCGLISRVVGDTLVVGPAIAGEGGK